MSVVITPSSFPNAPGPGTHDTHLEDTYQVRNGTSGIHRWTRAEMNDRVEMIGHDHVDVDLDAPLRFMQALERCFDEMTRIAQDENIFADIAEEILALMSTDRDVN